ncbi:hypothetical protein [Xanthomonas sp. LMG 12462]|uniref:hypothetical protein n=1 Tax=Xanthomonas sp. LMG 12462 TaxID=1591134 RepID=UPI001D051FB6|nr:hypothetical protein [Xanthomonas sp. LMG 12462]
MHSLPNRTPEEEIAEMAGEEKSKDNAKEGLPHFSLMEKAWDAQWVMRFVCIVLFIDGALVLKGGSGLLQWSTSTDKLWQDLGFLVVAAATFGLLVSFVLPTLGRLVCWMGYHIRRLARGVLEVEDRDDLEGAYGFVAAHKLQLYALERESDFLLRMYEAAWRREVQRREELDQIGNLVFATAFLAVADGLLAFVQPDGRSLVHDALAPLGDTGLVLGFVLLVVAGYILSEETWGAPDRPARVYYPPLYLQLAEERRQRRDEEWQQRLNEEREALRRKRTS